MENERFICVFSEEAEHAMSEAGYLALGRDKRSNIIYFYNDPELTPPLGDTEYLLTSTLLFGPCNGGDQDE